ncbi:MAG: hypothetical protein U5N56_03855 [Candidatus Marinimicrobia bacterium]|nr:hypothetical protein [Candidatus Neomarinimicrobiota bacterium]
MRKLNMLSLPRVQHRPAGLQAGAAFAFMEYVLPQLGVNIPFGGAYYFTGDIGAVNEPLFRELLTKYSLGFGTGGKFSGDSSYHYAAGTSVSNYRTPTYSNLSVAVHAQLMKMAAIYTGGGMEVSFQHQQIQENEILNEWNERVYILMPEIGLYSPYGNISIKALRNAFSAGISWTLKLE